MRTFTDCFRVLRIPMSGMALLSLLSCSISHADIVWTGNGTDANAVFAEDNYDFSGSSVTDITQSTTIDDNINISGASIIATDFSGFNSLDVGDNFTLTFTDSSFRTNANGGFKGNNDAADAFSFISLSNSSVNAQFIGAGLSVAIDGTSSFTLRGGGNPINPAFSNSSTSPTEPISVFLQQGGMLTMPSLANFAGGSADNQEGDFIFAHNALGDIVSYASDPTILSFSGSTGTAVFGPAAIPEPGSFAFLAAASLGLLRRRRRS